MDRVDVGGPCSRMAALAVACTADRRIHGQDQGLIASDLHLMDQFSQSAPVAVCVELKPKGAAFGVLPGHLPGQLRDRVQVGAGLVAEHHAALLAGGGQCHGCLAIGVRPALQGHRGHQQREGPGFAQQLAMGVPTAQVLQDPRCERPLLPGLLVAAQRDLVSRTAREIRPGAIVQHSPGGVFVVLQVDDGGAHVLAHCRSRL